MTMAGRLDQGTELEQQARALLEELAEALTSGKAGRVAAYWHRPAMAFSEGVTEALIEPDDVLSYSRRMIAGLRERGPGVASHRIDHLEALGPHLSMVDVTWSQPGDPTPTAKARYIVRHNPGEAARLCGAVNGLAAAASALDEAVDERTDDVTKALQDTFPASDPVAHSNPVTSVGPPS